MLRTIVLAAVLLGSLVSGAREARADGAASTPPAPPAAGAPWSAASPEVVERVRATKTLVVQVVVPLCSDQQIHCGGSWAGHPGGLKTNIYWGAIFGARTFLERPEAQWDRVDVSRGESPILEQVVFRRFVPGERWGVDGKVEAVVVLQAFHGSLIHQAVNALWQGALSGSEVSFRDGERERKLPVSVVGYAGHNRLMDGLRLPPKPAAVRPIPSFALACMSDKWFGSPLRDAGSPTLLTSRSYMAPEGYVIDAVAKALADNRSPEAIREAAVDATARWQRIRRPRADAVFAPAARR